MSLRVFIVIIKEKSHKAQPLSATGRPAHSTESVN